MKINYSTEKSDSIYHYTLSLLGINESDTSTLSTATFIRSANTWYRKTDSWIWNASTRWEFDDSNYDTLPYTTTTLVASRKDYTIDSDARNILRVEVKNDDGDYYPIVAVDQTDVQEAMTEYHEDDGAPQRYNMVGRSIELYPAPSSSDVTLAKGLKMFLSRDIEEFTTSDTTKEPGFDNHFHCLLAYGSALDFALSNGMTTKVNQLSSLIRETKDELANFYGRRLKDEKPKIKPKTQSNI